MSIPRRSADDRPPSRTLHEVRAYERLLGPERSLRRRLLRPALFVSIFLPILFMAIFGYRVVHRNLTEMLLARRQTIAHIIAVSLKERFDSLSEVGVSLASRVAFRQFIEAGEWEQAIDILEQVHVDLPYIDRVFLADPAGTLQADLPPSAGVRGRNFAYRDWYRGATTTGKAYISDVYVRTAEPRCTVVALAVPIRADDASLLGILVLQIRAETLLEWARETDVGAEGFVYFTDSKGTLAAHPRVATDKQLVDYSLAPPVRGALTGRSGVVISDSGRPADDRVIAYEPVPQYGWVVIVQQPTSAAFVPRDQTLLSLALIYGGVSLLSCALAVFTVLVIGALERRETLVRTLNSELARHAADLEQASQAKSRFVANISHELRSPLHAIIGYTELLAQGTRGPLVPEQADDLRVVAANGRHLLTLINDLIDVAKIESGRIDLVREPTVVRELVDEVLKSQTLAARQKGLRLRADVEDGLPPLLIDRRRLLQALLNVVQNAVKFTASGEVALRAARHGERLAISVSDTGPGIPADELASLFARFAQSKELGRVKKGEGMGLGLHLVKQLVELHGGTVRAENRPGGGTTIHISLPLPAAPDAGAATAPDDAGAQAPGARPSSPPRSPPPSPDPEGAS